SLIHCAIAFCCAVDPAAVSDPELQVIPAPPGLVDELGLPPVSEPHAVRSSPAPISEPSATRRCGRFTKPPNVRTEPERNRERTAAGATYKILRGFKVDMGYLEDEQLMNVPPQEKDTSLVQRNARNAS